MHPRARARSSFWSSRSGLGRRQSFLFVFLSLSSLHSPLSCTQLFPIPVVPHHFLSLSVESHRTPTLVPSLARLLFPHNLFRTRRIRGLRSRSRSLSVLSDRPTDRLLVRSPTPVVADRAQSPTQVSSIPAPRRLYTLKSTKLAGIKVLRLSFIRPLLGPSLWVSGGDKKPP